jgi:O-antigen ligase
VIAACSSKDIRADPLSSNSRLHEKTQGGGGALLSLAGFSAELWVIAIYLTATGVADLKAAKLGVMLGPLPLFFTDLTFLVVLATSFLRWPSRLLYWLSEGVGAGRVGRAVWLIMVMALIWFCLAISDYPLYAARDLAIFEYCMFYTLVYLAIRDRRGAVRLLQCFMYAGVIGAALLVVQATTGLDFGLFERERRVELGRTFFALRSGDANVFSALSLAALLPYVIVKDRLRVFHLGCIILCFCSMVASEARTGVVALAMAVLVTVYCTRSGHRARLLIAAAALTLPVVIAPLVPHNVPGASELKNLRLSVVSGAGGPLVDANAEFRAIRWRCAFQTWAGHPFLGVGFGREIIPAGLVDPGERKGQFNLGMPHNSFLYIGARAGLLGLALYLYCWGSPVMRLLVAFRRSHRVEDLAVANILVAMFGCAMFGLFIERPGTDASLWIFVAIGSRLAELSKTEGVRGCSTCASVAP